MGRLILKAATIVTMDDSLGDFECADLLVENGRIAAVGPDIGAVDAEAVDMRGRILIPGLVNAHTHTWQTGLRGIAADWTLLEYFRWMHAGLATQFTPEDIGIATLVGAYNQLNCGATTLVDWCHNNPTPAHTDAAVEALKESRIRSVFLHGSPKPDPKPGQPHFSETPHPRREVERLARGTLGARDDLVTLGLALLGPHYSTLEVSRHDLRLAREFGLIGSMHQGGGPEKALGGWEALDAEGLLGPWINIVHGNDLTDRRLDRMVDRGVTFSVAPEGEMSQGHGFPIVGRLRQRGVAPSLGVDLESLVSGDMFSVARCALASQRALDNAQSRRERGTIPETSTIPVREALCWITVQGAKMLGLWDRIGSLTPGKQADVVAIDARQLNMQPVHDPVSSVVMQAGLANVEAVMVGGQWRKREGRLLVGGLPAKLEALARSGRRIAEAVGISTNLAATRGKAGDARSGRAADVR
jgi:cytosine/adenosine deaminase-related metal-dependent hydrolase